MSIYARIVGLIIVLVVLAGIALKIDHAGYQRSEVKWLAKEGEAKDKLAAFNETQRLLERAWATKLDKAQNERTKKEQNLQPLIAASRSELSSLRDTINTINANASGESVNTCIARASTARDIFEQCAKRYSDMAGKADGHAADAVMLQDAWPK